MQSKLPHVLLPVLLSAALWCAVGLLAAGCAPDADPAPRPADARIVLRTGATLNYVEQGPATGAPVVLLHGYTDSSYSFARIMPLLPGDLRIFALDQRGHGRSSKTLGSHTMADFVADVVAFLDAMQIDRATLVGHSMGSLVAQQVAIGWPQRIDRLVLIGSMTQGANPVTRALLEDVRRLTDPVDRAFVREFQRSTLFAPVPEAFFDRVVADSLAVPAAVWRQAGEDFLQQDTTPGLGGIAAPTLILWGEHDAIFPRADQQTLDRLVHDSTLQVLPAVGHAPHWERPEQVAELLTAFLRAPDASR